jgi:hypothetical protein
MPIRELLATLTNSRVGEVALHTALLVAARFQAHLCALYIHPDNRDVAPMVGDGFSSDMVEGILAAAEQENSQRSHAVQAMFARLLQLHRIAESNDPRRQGASASFLILSGREDEVIAERARLADLAIVPHPESDDDVSSSDALHAVLFDSGRPVLIAPHERPSSLGKRICLGWNGTAESAAAVLGGLSRKPCFFEPRSCVDIRVHEHRSAGNAGFAGQPANFPDRHLDPV